MSCRPAVMPQTKSYLVRRLDGVEQEVTLLRKATGVDCLDKVSAWVGCSSFLDCIGRGEAFTGDNGGKVVKREQALRISIVW